MRRVGKVVCVDGDPDRTHLLAAWAEPNKCPYVVSHVRPVVSELGELFSSPIKSTMPHEVVVASL